MVTDVGAHIAAIVAHGVAGIGIGVVTDVGAHIAANIAHGITGIGIGVILAGVDGDLHTVQIHQLGHITTAAAEQQTHGIGGGGEVFGHTGPFGFIDPTTGDAGAGFVAVKQIPADTHRHSLVVKADGVAATGQYGEGLVQQVIPSAVTGQFTAVVALIGGILRHRYAIQLIPAFGVTGLKATVFQRMGLREHTDREHTAQQCAHKQ